MKREVLKRPIKTILVEHRRGDANTEDASEAVMKVFEKSLEESIGEVTKMLPKGLFSGLFKDGRSK